MNRFKNNETEKNTFMRKATAAKNEITSSFKIFGSSAFTKLFKQILIIELGGFLYRYQK